MNPLAAAVTSGLRNPHHDGGRGLVSGTTVARSVVGGGTAVSLTTLLITVRNLRLLQQPSPGVQSRTDTPGTRVSVLLPLRNEAHRARPCLEALLAELADGTFDELLILDDDSDDGTAEMVGEVLADCLGGDDPRVRLLRGHSGPPPGWLGKPWACARLADQATGEVLVFVDADVVVAPGGVVRAVGLLDGPTSDGRGGVDVVCPYPRQVTAGRLGRLVQPLLQWSWLAALPLDVAHRSRRPSTAAGNGQLLVVRTAAYRAAGGHAAVRDAVLEDVALVRTLRSVGFVGGMADGTDLASCRMYDSDAELVDGYTKSLWSAFGTPAGATSALAVLGLAYVAPPAAAVLARDSTTRAIGALGYVAAVSGRLLVARRTGQRRLPDALAHPASILAFGCLVAESFRRRRRGRLAWRGRPVEVA